MSLLPHYSTLSQDVYENSRKSLYCKSPAGGKWFTAQLSNAGYVQMVTFLGSSVRFPAEFPTQTFKGKQLVSHKIYAKNLKHS